MIPEGINITGDIDGTGHLRIDGKVKGNVQLRGRLEVGVNGQVDGDLHAEDVLVLGLVRGNIHSRSGLLLKAKCRVQGNISCRSLTVEGGAWFCGRCDMRGESVTQAKEKPSEKVDMRRPVMTAERPGTQSPGSAAPRPEQQPVPQEGRAIQPKLG